MFIERIHLAVPPHYQRLRSLNYAPVQAGEALTVHRDGKKHPSQEKRDQEQKSSAEEKTDREKEEQPSEEHGARGIHVDITV